VGNSIVPTLALDIDESLYGKHLVLDVLSPEHADFLSDCYANNRFMNAYRLSQARNLESQTLHTSLVKKQQYLALRQQGIEWVIRRKKDAIGNRGELLGLAALADYQAGHNRAEFLVGFLDPKDARAGLGLEASLLVLEFAFQKVKLHKLITLVYQFNKSAQGNTLHLGFSQEAVFREHYFDPYQKRFIDLYQNALLAREFFASKSLARWSKRLLGRDITQQPIVKKPEGVFLSKEELAKACEDLLKKRLG